MATLCINKLENGSTLLEWVGDGWRFGISIEQDPTDSSWFFVSKEVAESGYLSGEFLEIFPGTNSLNIPQQVADIGIETPPS